jgi:TRAP-type C4-dicarboxylate transport system substrate-binding protein
MCFAISETTWKALSEEQQRIIEAAAQNSALEDREMNRRQTEELLSALEEEGMKINEPDLKPFAAVTASVLEDNRSIYGTLLEETLEWISER